MSDRRRVWITGIGLITAIGTGVDAFRAGLRAGRSPVTRIDRFDPSPFRSQVAAQVDDFDPLAWMPPKTARQLDRFSQFGLVAGRLALDDAGLTPGVGGARRPGADRDLPRARRSAASPTPRSSTSATSRSGIRQVAPNLALAVFGGAAPANLGIALDVRGPILSTANSCASGAVALGEALGDLREGRVDAAIAGGVRDPAQPARLRRVRHHPGAVGRPQRRAGTAARPFDAGRDGFVMGEGAALLVLEAADVAEARGAVPYAELLGYGATSDAHHMVQPRADGTRGGAGRDDRARRRRRRRRTRSTTSTPMPRRRRSATSPRPGRSPSPSASGRRRSRSAGRRRSTATRSGRPARSRRRSAR